jgi:phospholipid-translocating ATPase
MEAHISVEESVVEKQVHLTKRRKSLLENQRIHGILTHYAQKWYKAIFLELILRQKELPQSKDGRRVRLKTQHDKPLVDERRGHAYVSNTIRTSRYTIYDFFPKQLIFQFTRLGNFYFLCVGIPQTIPGLSTTGNVTTILPLLFFVLLTIAKEGYDDYRRHRLDKVENASFATVLRRRSPAARVQAQRQGWLRLRSQENVLDRVEDDEEFDGIMWTTIKWSDIKVGDVIKLSRDDAVPADIVLLHADGESSLAYIETMALDGETNLKSRQVSTALKNCATIEGIDACNAEFVLEDPNPDLYRFDGRVTVDGKTLPLTLADIIYRGSILRNTSHAIGMVINTGEECKIRLNANQHPEAKKPALERVSNRIVITLAIYVIVLSVGCSMGYLLWQKSTEEYSQYLRGAAVAFHEIIIGFIIQFNNVIPLALYVSLEIVKIGQMIMLNSDIKMYDHESDTPAKCNTNTILENLGQVGYIFSDKTGTLTENVMKFRKMSIAGTAWLHESDLEQTAMGEQDAETCEAVSKPAEHVRFDAPAITIPEDDEAHTQTPATPSRLSFARRSSSHWRSTGRPDHVQPEVTTKDLLEYIRLRPHSPFARRAREYCLAMALCHTCLPEIRGGKIEYQAASPDELALVQAARELGYTVTQRSSQSITLRVAGANDGKDLTFEILDVIEFSSKRKRMSVLVRYPDGRISMICKGADSVILPRLKMAHLAIQKATDVRKSAELERELMRQSGHYETRNSFGGGPSLSLVRKSIGVSRNISATKKRPAPAERSKSFEAGKLGRSDERPRLSINTRTLSFDASRSAHPHTSKTPLQTHATTDRFAFLDDTATSDDGVIFSQCFKHLDEFATEGLRTLLFAQKFISEKDYQTWKKAYHDATTSLLNRQELIEAAGDLIEQSFDLVGASAIEDKLQKGVPETIDKLRRANIKIWMLTGDKRETAINIAHSARICRPGSELFVLDISKGSLEDQLLNVQEELQADAVHSVVVIDGHTLAAVEQSPELSTCFYAVMPLVDSVICCRASPAQKALLVRTVRARLHGAKGTMKRGLTLAIGDGANDLAMIQASHVGVGISGKEGLQAARVADYAIAQFRFLQRLLLVHGRWNYVRTAKFVLCTFWKELFFYLPTALYQRYNGYTGTSLYESASLTVFNTLFTSLCVICMGVWEQDLRATTLLAVPELYVYGQRNMGLNLGKYAAWMFGAAAEGVVAWFGVWAGYAWFARGSDQGLFALGDLSFTVGVLWINWKLL